MKAPVPSNVLRSVYTISITSRRNGPPGEKALFDEVVFSLSASSGTHKRELNIVGHQH